MPVRLQPNSLALLFVVAGLAVVLRLGYQASIFEHDALQGEPYLDTQEYDRASMELWKPDANAPFFKPPGYPVFLRALRFAGATPRGVVTAQAALEGATAFLVGWLVLACHGARPGGGVESRARFAALFAATLYAVSPPAIYFSAERLETTLTCFLVAAHALLVVQTFADSALSARRRAITLVLAGATLGAAGLVRPNLLLGVVPLLAFGVRAFGARRALLILAGAGALVLPVTLRNWVVADDPVLVSSNGGINFYLGNVRVPELHDAVPYYEVLPGPVPSWEWTLLFRQADEAGATRPSEASRWHTRQALAAMAGDPLEALRVLGSKAIALTNAFELSNNRDLHREGSVLALGVSPFVGFGLYVPLLVAFLLSRNKPPGAGPVAWLTLAVAISVWLFFVSERHRAPLVPLLTALGGLGAAHLVTALRSRAPGRGRIVTLFVVTMVVAHIDWLGQRDRYRNFVIAPASQGALLAQKGDLEGAARLFRLGLERTPDDPWLLSNLGLLYVTAGDPGSAVPLLEESLRIHPDGIEAWNNLALAWLEAGDPANAERVLALGLERFPDSKPLLAMRDRVRSTQRP